MRATAASSATRMSASWRRASPRRRLPASGNTSPALCSLKTIVARRLRLGGSVAFAVESRTEVPVLHWLHGTGGRLDVDGRERPDGARRITRPRAVPIDPGRFQLRVLAHQVPERGIRIVDRPGELIDGQPRRALDQQRVRLHVRPQRGGEIVDRILARVPFRVLGVIGRSRVPRGVDAALRPRQVIEPGRPALSRGRGRRRLEACPSLDRIDLQRRQRPDSTGLASLSVLVGPGRLEVRVLHHHVRRFLVDGGAAASRGPGRRVQAEHFDVRRQRQRELPPGVVGRRVDRVLRPEAWLRIPHRHQLAVAALGHPLDPSRNGNALLPWLAPAVQLRGRLGLLARPRACEAAEGDGEGQPVHRARPPNGAGRPVSWPAHKTGPPKRQGPSLSVDPRCPFPSSAQRSSKALSAVARTGSRTLAFNSFILSRLFLKESISSAARAYSVPSVSTQWSMIWTPESSICEYVLSACWTCCSSEDWLMSPAVVDAM